MSNPELVGMLDAKIHFLEGQCGYVSLSFAVKLQREASEAI